MYNFPLKEFLLAMFLIQMKVLNWAKNQEIMLIHLLMIVKETKPQEKKYPLQQI